MVLVVSAVSPFFFNLSNALAGGCRKVLLLIFVPMNKTVCIFLFTALWFLGCYSPERDLGLDPINKPLLHILSAEYDGATGTDFYL